MTSTWTDTKELHVTEGTVNLKKDLREKCGARLPAVEALEGLGRRGEPRYEVGGGMTGTDW